MEICQNQTWGMVSGAGWGEEDARVTCRQLKLPVEGDNNIVQYNKFNTILQLYFLQILNIFLILLLASLIS